MGEDDHRGASAVGGEEELGAVEVAGLDVDVAIGQVGLLADHGVADVPHVLPADRVAQAPRPAIHAGDAEGGPGQQADVLAAAAGVLAVFAAVGGAPGGAGEVALAHHVAEQGVAGFVEGGVGGRLGAAGQVGRQPGGEAAGQQGEDQQHDGHLDQGEAGGAA